MIIAVLDKRGKDAAGQVVRVIKALLTEHTEGFGVATPTINLMDGDIDDLQRQSVNSTVAVGYTFPKAICQDTPESVKSDNAKFVFSGRIYPPTQTGTAEASAKIPKQNRNKTINELYSEVEGDFAFILLEKSAITAGRDSVGVHPLYYGENRNVAALAANRRALWKLGIETTGSFPPGHLAVVSREGFKFRPVKTLVYEKPQPTTMKEAMKQLQRLLEDSIRRRVSGLNEVAVAFSGGLDSSMIAFLTKKCQVNVQLIHVSLKNQAEIEDARNAAEELHLPIQIHCFEERDVERVAAKVVELIEESDPVKTAIGIPFYWIAEKTAESGFKVLLSGQGADELFGGYKRYINDYLLHKKEEVRRNMFKDASELHESNIDRDAKICDHHGVELRLPFASYAIVDFASSLPLELKIEKKAESLRKLVLRRAAEEMGLPAVLVKKPKKAMQYSTGINDALKRVAKRQNLTIKEYVNTLFLKLIQPYREASMS